MCHHMIGWVVRINWKVFEKRKRSTVAEFTWVSSLSLLSFLTLQILGRPSVHNPPLLSCCRHCLDPKRSCILIRFFEPVFSWSCLLPWLPVASLYLALRPFIEHYLHNVVISFLYTVRFRRGRLITFIVPNSPLAVVLYWKEYREIEYNHEKLPVIWGSNRGSKEVSPGKKLEMVPLNPFFLALRLFKFANSIRTRIIMNTLHPRLHPQILFDLTYNATMGNEYRLFELCSNGKQNSGTEYHSNQTLTEEVFRI